MLLSVFQFDDGHMSKINLQLIKFSHELLVSMHVSDAACKTTRWAGSRHEQYMCLQCTCSMCAGHICTLHFCSWLVLEIDLCCVSALWHHKGDQPQQHQMSPAAKEVCERHQAVWSCTTAVWEAARHICMNISIHQGHSRTFKDVKAG